MRLQLGLDRLQSTSALLQRARLADPEGGIWEAADVQWWWRRPRRSDDVALPVWSDDDGPVAAVALTDWGTRVQLDALVVPATEVVDLETVWGAARDAAEVYEPVDVLEVLVREDDDALVRLLDRDGFTPTEDRSGTTWLDPARRPALADVPTGFRIVDRSAGPRRPHPMVGRNGEEVESRLRQCPLYDPSLDLGVETTDGEDAGYALFWFDPVTGVGMLEPMRVEDRFQRRGLARALLTDGLDRLARRGAARLKVGFDGPAGEALYLGAGFEPAGMVRSFTRNRT